MQTSFANMAQPVVIELDALLRDYLLGLVLIAGADANESRAVQWVHSSDLIDPTPFLTPRTVLLTTGRQFEGLLEAESVEGDLAELYVRRLLDAGVTALGVTVGVQWDRIPPALIAACERLQLPLFRVPYDTPFIAIVRTAARLLDAESHRSAVSGHEPSELGSMLDRRRNLADAEQALRHAVLSLLLEQRHNLAEEIARPLVPQLPRGQVSVLSVQIPPHVHIGSELTAATHARPGVFSARHGSTITIIAEANELGELRRLFTTQGLDAGVSERGTLADLSELVEQAERAAELARLQHAGAPVHYRPEMHAGVLRLLRSSPEATRRSAGLLAPLRQHDARHDDSLTHSLQVWLSHHGQTSPAAAELHIHRHTLRSRVTAAGDLLQRDLSDPDTRAELWTAFRLTEREDHEPDGRMP